MTVTSGAIFRVRSVTGSANCSQRGLNLSRTASTASSDGEGQQRNLATMQPQQQQTGTNEPTKTSFVNITKAKVDRQKPKTIKTRLSKKMKKLFTPSRNNSGSDDKYQTQTSSVEQISMLSTSFANDYKMFSSEQDPSLFQMELPNKKEVLVHSKICALMDGYSAIHRDFDFNTLCGHSHSFLEQEHAKSSKEDPLILGSCHRDLVQGVINCHNDIVVEGFFREYEYSTDEANDKESERMEACILSSDRMRQIIVCFKSSIALSKSMFSGKESPCIVHKEQSVPVMATFQTAYFATAIEEKVFAFLSNLTARKPFYDVAFLGHDFSAAMASIAALRYASLNSHVRAICHVFGSPRIGGEEWRQKVHSIPNLRVYRVENGNDPYVAMPAGAEWKNCGHAIQISGNGDAAKFKARRFDRRPSTESSNNFFSMVGKGKVDHKIQSYEQTMSSSGEKWFGDFCEMKGNGIQANNEMRTLA